MKNASLTVCALLTCCTLLVAAAEVDVPDDIRNTLADFHQAIQMGDLEAAQAYLTPIAIMQSHFAGLGQQGNVLRLAQTYELESLQSEYIDCKVDGDWALVEYDLKVNGVNKKTGEEAQEVWRQMQRLNRLGPGWRIVETTRLDPQREQKVIREDEIVDEDWGIRAPIPEGWTPHVVLGMANVAAGCDAPDLKTSIGVIAMDLPVDISAKAAAKAGVESREQLGATGKVISEGETQLAGEPAYELRTDMTIGDITMFVHYVFRVDRIKTKRTLYGLIFASFATDGLDKYQQQFDEFRNGLQITEAKQQELPPELGKVADGKYINEEYEVQLTIPDGWEPTISKQRFLFQLILGAPEGDSTLLFAAVDLGQWVDPKLAAYGDLKVYRGQDPNLQVLAEAPISKGSVDGYQILSKLTLADDRPRNRWQVFLMRDTILYFIVGEAVPASDYDNVQDDWGEVLKSIQFGPVE